MKNIKLPFLLVIYVTLIAGCNHQDSEKREPIRNVILADIETSGEATIQTYPGVVEEGKSVNAAFMTGGKLSTVNLKEGDRVRKGQLIATIDDSDYQIGVNQLQVQYDQMVAEKKRIDEMYARHNVAPNDYEKFTTGFEQLRLQLDMAKNKLGYTKLYSPSDGFISFRFMQPGELVDAGTPIYKITDDSKLKVSVDLPLSVYLDRDNIKKVYGKIPSNPEDMPLKVESFTPDADNNQLYHMQLEIPASSINGLTTGMNMTVMIEMKNEVNGESLIPSRSIFYDNGKTYVWIYNDQDSTLSSRQIAVIGQPREGRNMVTGLNGDEKIVATGVKQLKDGEKVNVISSPLKTK